MGVSPYAMAPLHLIALEASASVYQPVTHSHIPSASLQVILGCGIHSHVRMTTRRQSELVHSDPVYLVARQVLIYTHKCLVILWQGMEELARHFGDQGWVK